MQWSTWLIAVAVALVTELCSSHRQALAVLQVVRACYAMNLRKFETRLRRITVLHMHRHNSRAYMRLTPPYLQACGCKRSNQLKPHDPWLWRIHESKPPRDGVDLLYARHGMPHRHLFQKLASLPMLTAEVTGHVQLYP